MCELGRLIKLEYGAALLAEFRTGHGFPVFGSNGEVGRHSKCLVEGPGIIVGRKGSVGKVSWSSESFWPIDTTYFVSATKEKLKWLYWILYWLPLERLDTSTGVPGLNRNDVYSLSVFEPSDDEKRMVAQILDTLDTTIRQTEAIIAKLQQVKQGLLHDLLTRGIDANGQLRPPVEQAPHLYKESPLGWVPREWDLSNLGEKTDWFSGGTPSKAHRLWWSGDIPFLTPKDMKRFEIEETIENITMEAAHFGSKLMSAETVFIVVRGMILAHTFPVCISSCPLVFNQDIKAISGRCDISSRFLAHWFVANSSMFLRKVTEATHGTKKLDLQILHTTLIGIPSPEEQTRIVRRIESIDHAISVELARHNQTKSLKSALMDDLLTGRVRVTALLSGETPVPEEPERESE
ncbi:MAG TPA: restriction endonuclease subunit S [Candidatus Competibacter sp.]|nr:restriction endonuclease subunit S [Candidatus Competibacter sp.]